MMTDVDSQYLIEVAEIYFGHAAETEPADLQMIATWWLAGLRAARLKEEELHMSKRKTLRRLHDKGLNGRKKRFRASAKRKKR